MERSSLAAVAAVALLLLAGCSVGYQPAGESTDTPPRTGPSGPPADGHLGYYDGYWHNQTLHVNATDGLTEAEAEAVFSRAMARVQLLRGLAFEEDVDLELLTREEFRREYGGEEWAEPTGDRRTLDNVQHEAMLLVGPDRDVVDVRAANRGDLVLGFYQPSDGRLVVVSEHDPATLDDELTLAHELVHALQDQRFDLVSTTGEPTLDGRNARNGLVEGSALVVEHAYQRRCESGAWECVRVGDGHQPVAPDEAFHFGVYFVGFVPYAEGPSFVAHHRERGGWAAVGEMFDAVPSATAELIHPSTYGTEAYGEATLEDHSTGEWERVDRGGEVEHATVGQAGIAATFVYTAYADPRPGVVDREDFENTDDDGGLDPIRPFTYDVSPAEGWHADRLHAYERGDETAHVWNVTFNDAANASEFAVAYGESLEFWRGEAVESRGNATVWSLEDGEEFDGAVWVDRDGRSVTVVKAPAVEALGDVHAPAGAAVAEPAAVRAPAG